MSLRKISIVAMWVDVELKDSEVTCCLNEERSHTCFPFSESGIVLQNHDEVFGHRSCFPGRLSVQCCLLMYDGELAEGWLGGADVSDALQHSRMSTKHHADLAQLNGV